MIKDFKYYVEWARSTWFGVLHQAKYCPVWDRKLNKLLDKYSKEAVGDHYTVQLGEVDVWWENRFYAYGFLRKGDGWAVYANARPSVKTMIRLAKLQDEMGSVKANQTEQFIKGLK